MAARRFGVDYDNSVESNRELWSKHTWSKDGDEWDGQAVYLKVPYEEWKQSLVDEFILPNIKANNSALEIAAGYGRWSVFLQPLCSRLILVDLNPQCIEQCKKKFSTSDNVEYRVTDGSTLPDVADQSIDFIWSFDSFVHMDPAVIRAYFQEMRRVLTPSGKAIVHHAGRSERWRWLGSMRKYSSFLRKIYTWLSMGTWKDHDGWRSNVSGELIQELADETGLVLEFQTRRWGAGNRYGTPRFNDLVSCLRVKPAG